jgi:N-methylhydantoinase B
VVGGNHETSQRIVDAIMRAFSDTLPERLTAGGPTTAGGLILAGRNQDGVYRVFFELHGGGEGARIDRDGMPCVRVHLVNTANTPAEVVEAEYAIRVEEQSLRRGSGGTGAHRGGDGLARAYRILAPEMTLTTVFERRVVPPYGLEGGEAGEPFRVTVERADGTREELPGKANLTVHQGDMVLVESCGGGGYGVPA